MAWLIEQLMGYFGYALIVGVILVLRGSSRQSGYSLSSESAPTTGIGGGCLVLIVLGLALMAVFGVFP